MICPTCFGQFDYSQKKDSDTFNERFDTAPGYYSQPLAFAQGTPYDDLGFEGQRFKPEVLKRYQESAAAEPAPEA